MSKFTAALGALALVVISYGAWLVLGGFRMNHAQTVASDELSVTVGEVTGQSHRYIVTTDTVYLPALDRHVHVVPRPDESGAVGPIRRIEYDLDDPAVARYPDHDVGRLPGWVPVAAGTVAILLGAIAGGATLRRLVDESSVRVIEEPERLRLARAVVRRHGGAG